MSYTLRFKEESLPLLRFTLVLNGKDTKQGNVNALFFTPLAAAKKSSRQTAILREDFRFSYILPSHSD